MTQSNLGAALRILGERKEDGAVICEALGKQVIAWEVLVMDSPYNATIVENHAKSAVAALKNAVDVGSIR
jgi:hypothetical protein